MKIEPRYTPHLDIVCRLLKPGEEWEPRLSGWALIRILSGAGYWLHDEGNQELRAGAVILTADAVGGKVRASQINEMSVQYFRVEPDFLTGLLALGEHRFLETAKFQRGLAWQIMPPESLTAVNFQNLMATPRARGFSFRLKLLQLFAENFDDHMEKRRQAADTALDARRRLQELLEQTAASDLLHLSFPDLAQRMCCTPRHLSRVFRDVVGMSFREKQAEIRLAQARKLLATTEFKVVDVALESGYQSLSLFGLMFKKRFGLSPGKWRENQRARVPRNRRWMPRATS